MFKFFKKKPPAMGPQRARELGLITEREQLKLEFERAEEKLKNFGIKKEKKRK
jgi:hypothetical protein